MKALSLWQPWASFIAKGLKLNETRSWYTSYRGPLAIAATKNIPKVDREECEDLFEELKEEFPEVARAFYGVKFSDLPTGAVLCTTNLIDCTRTELTPDKWALTELEQYMGNYGPDRFAWITRDPQAFEQPIPARGGQGLWEWDGAPLVPYAQASGPLASEPDQFGEAQA